MPEPIEAELVGPPVVIPPMMAAPPEPGAIVVPAVTAAASAARKSQVGKRETPKQIVSYPVNGMQVDVELSAREYNVITRYIDSLNIFAAAAEFGMGYRATRRFMESPRVAGYVSYRFKQKAAAASLTTDKVLAKLNGAIDGTDPITDVQLTAIGHATKFLKPTASTQITLNQQNNFSSGGPPPAAASPYAKMGRVELLAEMREVVSVAGDPEDEPAKPS